MKKLKYVSMSILILNLFNYQIHTKFITSKDFQTIQKKSFNRIIFASSLLCLNIYLYKDTLLESIQLYPVTSFVLLYLMANYIIDSYYAFKKINSILTILKSSENINKYLLCALLLNKNKYFYKNSNAPIHEHINEKIHEYSGFYIHEIEKITTAFNTKALEYFNKFDIGHFDFQFTELKNMLNQQNLSLHQIIPLFQEEAEIYKDLIYLENNTDVDIDIILQKIGSKIKNEIQLLLKKI